MSYRRDVRTDDELNDNIRRCTKREGEAAKLTMKAMLRTSLPEDSYLADNGCGNHGRPLTDAEVSQKADFMLIMPSLGKKTPWEYKVSPSGLISHKTDLMARYSVSNGWVSWVVNYGAATNSPYIAGVNYIIPMRKGVELFKQYGSFAPSCVDFGDKDAYRLTASQLEELHQQFPSLVKKVIIYW
jgi:hypothetical protein